MIFLASLGLVEKAIKPETEQQRNRWSVCVFVCVLQLWHYCRFNRIAISGNLRDWSSVLVQVNQILLFFNICFISIDSLWGHEARAFKKLWWALLSDFKNRIVILLQKRFICTNPASDHLHLPFPLPGTPVFLVCNAHASLSDLLHCWESGWCCPLFKIGMYSSDAFYYSSFIYFSSHTITIIWWTLYFTF